MSLDHAILGFLALEPMTGYDLRTRCLSPSADSFWTADQAQIYRTLERLSASGLVSALRQRQSGKPDRKVYRLTEEGARALSAWLSQAREPTPVRDSFLLQVMLSWAEPDDVLVDVFTAQRQARQARLEEVRAAIAHITRQEPTPTRAGVLRRLALEGEAATHRAAIDWIDDCLDTLEGGLPGSDRVIRDGQRQLFPVTADTRGGRRA